MQLRDIPMLTAALQAVGGKRLLAQAAAELDAIVDTIEGNMARSAPVSLGGSQGAENASPALEALSGAGRAGQPTSC